MYDSNVNTVQAQVQPVNAAFHNQILSQRFQNDDDTCEEGSHDANEGIIVLEEDTSR